MGISPKFEEVIDAVYEAGGKIKGHFGRIEAKNYKSWHPADVVTKLDEEAEIFLAEKLAVIDPAAGFKGEEFGEKKVSDRHYLVDPIDGTGYFQRGIQGCTTMLALVSGKDILFSAIYDFVNDEMFVAERGRGAFKNGKPIHVSNRPLSEAFIYYESRLENEEEVKKYLAMRKKCMVLGSYPSGSLLTRVAEGKADGRIVISGFGKDYDHAPGMLIIAEAGGIVANIGKKDLDFRDLNFIAANKFVYEELTSGPDAMFPVL